MTPTESAAPSSTVLLSVATVARRLECSRMHVYRLIDSGELETLDIAAPGSNQPKTRIRESVLADYLGRATKY
jgi:excisionase family DNA binding protein